MSKAKFLLKIKFKPSWLVRSAPFYPTHSRRKGDSQDLIGPAVSQQLRQSLADVSAVAKPLISSRSSNKNRSLPEALEAERGQVAVLYEELTDRRLELTKTACEVLDAFGNLFDTIIRTLEQTKHGSMARNVKAQADHLAVAAESTEAKLRLTKHDAMSAIYTPEVKEALIRYEEHLRDTDARLQQRAKTAEEILARYASMGGDEVKDIVKRYGEVTKDIEMTRADIKRLGGEI
ncbi:MAG: hypothetical protein M4579_005245 [Chaenotheca gracillima]|nr:MAG: hypothetical protein M4579_005245 [Chaenotheca gracillima]